MGNYVSCTLSAPLGKSSKSIKVVFPGGEIRQLSAPTKAAELMLETPNFFLVNSRSLQIGRRFSPLSADEDLELSNVYVMFPMKRVNSTVTAADMGALFLKANSVSKRGFVGKVRILPESGDLSPDKNEAVEVRAVPRLNLDDIEDFSAPEFMHRFSMSRSRKPMLETIAEEPICSR
ncbi:hypothetical protein SLE2022_275140 [Rubroshorea leprosula]